MASTQQMIEEAVTRFAVEVPALRNLKLIVGLELQGRGDLQVFRVELPGPKVSKGVPSDARLTVSMPRSQFNELAEDGSVSNYRQAYTRGQIKVSGDSGVQKLIATVIERHEERAKLKKVH